MRPIDFCHPYETACTRTSHVPGYAAAAFTAWAPPEVWASAGLTGEPSVFTTPGTLRRIFEDTRFDDVSCVCWPRAFGCLPKVARAWAFSSHGALERPSL
jgi:hypothetical protein